MQTKRDGAAESVATLLWAKQELNRLPPLLYPAQKGGGGPVSGYLPGFFSGLRSKLRGLVGL